MQPNDQNQQPQNPSTPSGGYMSPSGAEVPEYLHMEPVAELKPKKSKKKIIVGVLIFLLVLLFIGAGIGYWWWMKTEPERQFYTALDVMMQIKFIERQYTLTDGDTTRTSVNAQSDFSKVESPSSSLQYTIKQINQGGHGLIEGQAILFPDKAYTRVDNGTVSVLKNNQTSIGKWEELDDEKLKNNPINQAYSGVNTPIDIVPIGAYTESQRSEILDFMRASEVYSVKSSRNVNIDGQDSYLYSVSITQEKANRLAKKISDYTHGGVSMSTANAYEVNLWINKKTMKLMKYTAQETGKQSGTYSQALFTYPDKVIVEVPR